MTRIKPAVTSLIFFVLAFIPALNACRGPDSGPAKISVPEGFYSVLEVPFGGGLYRFGPFAGYYFRPEDPEDLSRLEFICFNEGNSYTNDLPEDVLLFTGQARLTKLPETGHPIPAGPERIIPVFAEAIPPAWLATRPEPANGYRHFHSCYDDGGAVLLGYWLLHEGEESFTYDMGGRVGPASVLYHEVSPGVDLKFAEIVEFDHGRRGRGNKN